MKRRIFLYIAVPALVTVLALSAVFLGYALPAFERIIDGAHRQRLQDITALAVSELRHFYALERSGSLSRAEAQHQAQETLRAIRYGANGREYVWINDLHPRLIMHPYRPDLEGRDMGQYADRSGHLLFREFARIARTQGQGFTQYLWQRHDRSDIVVPKLSHVRLFAPWGWVVGSGVYLDDLKCEIASAKRTMAWMLGGALGLVIIVLTGLVVVAVRSESRRKQTETALRHSERMLESIVSFLPDATLVLDAAGRVRLWNRACEQQSGVPAGQMLGKDARTAARALFADTVDVLVAACWLDPDTSVEGVYRQVTRTGDLISAEISVETTDSQRHYWCAAAPLRSADGTVTGVVESVRDMTERIRLQHAVVQSEKIAALGGLAAGIAHEINNPVAGIVLSADLSKSRLRADNRTTADALAACGIEPDQWERCLERIGVFTAFDAIHDSAMRISEIADSVLGLARAGTEVTAVPARDLVQRALTLARSQFRMRGNAAIEVHPDVQTDARIRCNATAVIQVLLNLLQNAADALNEAPTDHPTIRVSVDQPDREHVRIAVEDNGPGMDAATCSRVFEPFFTTKPQGKGTGLGLSLSHHIIVDEHGGDLSVESRPGHGARFTAILPAAHSPA